jgi:hypothetical protein
LTVSDSDRQRSRFGRPAARLNSVVKPHPVGLASQCSRPVFAVDFTGIEARDLIRR